MALTHAHHDGRLEFAWSDIVEAMTTVESGTAIGTEYIPEETRAVALHEAGHAATAHVYMKGAESNAALDLVGAEPPSATTRRARRRSASAPGARRRSRS